MDDDNNETSVKKSAKDALLLWCQGGLMHMRPILNMYFTVHTAQFCFLTLTTNNSVEGGGGGR